ncbi:MAG: hypothetical protein BroJett042_00510 [Bacteroidota bacterium]|nr:MAG: hypothetical protein BroJett042_00510 [Bacteroidota bacterium]
MPIKLNIKILIALIGVSHVLFGQSNSGNNLTFSLGPSFPTGKFSNYDFQKGERGSAQPGVCVDASFTHNLNNTPFGYQAGFRFSSFSRDGEELFDTHVPEEGQYDFGGSLYFFKAGKRSNLSKPMDYPNRVSAK